jgi:DnaJ-domain-containing protein 1
MTDCFALLDEPRRPAIDLEALKATFLARSAETHPDRSHGAGDAERQLATDRYSALNSAYNTLRNPKERLGHLLELERGCKPAGIESVPAEWMDGFMEVGQLCRAVDAFLADQAKVTSPLIKVQRFQQAMEWTDQLNALAGTLNAKLEAAMGGLQLLNQAWSSAPPVGDSARAASLPLDQLERAFRTVSFVSRWIAQLRERVVRLAI